MKVDDFIEKQEEKNGKFGIFYPPSTDKEALDAITEHFLGKDWCSFNPVSSEQINTEIVCIILDKTQPKSLFKRIFNI